MSDQLWAPWRTAYLDGPRSGEGCFMCAHPAETARHRENLILAVEEHAFVCLNRYPYTTAHVMVAPRRHVADLGELVEEEYLAMMVLLREAAVRVRRVTGATGMNVGFNLGADAGASHGGHLHAHLVPRKAGDTNFMAVIADVRVMPEYLDTTWGKLAPAFAELNR